MDTVWYCIYKKSDFSEIEGNVNVLCILEHYERQRIFEPRANEFLSH